MGTYALSMILTASGIITQPMVPSIPQSVSSITIASMAQGWGVTVFATR